MSAQYGGRDETCPVSTAGRRGGIRQRSVNTDKGRGGRSEGAGRARGMGGRGAASGEQTGRCLSRRSRR